MFAGIYVSNISTISVATTNFTNSEVGIYTHANVIGSIVVSNSIFATSDYGIFDGSAAATISLISITGSTFIGAGQGLGYCVLLISYFSRILISIYR